MVGAPVGVGWPRLMCLRSIDHVAAASPDAFAAIKVTALGRPEVSRRESSSLRPFSCAFAVANAHK